MRIARQNLTVETAAEDTGRPVIESILFDRDGTISADGFRLTFVPYPDGPAAGDDPVVGMLLPILAARRLASAADDDDQIDVRRASGEPPTFEVAILPPGWTQDGGVGRFVVPARTEGPYPSREKIVPTTSTHEVALQTAYLRSLADVFEGLGCFAVRLRMTESDAPVLVEAYGWEAVSSGPHDGPAPFVVVMPVKTVTAVTP